MAGYRGVALPLACLRCGRSTPVGRVAAQRPLGAGGITNHAGLPALRSQHAGRASCRAATAGRGRNHESRWRRAGKPRASARRNHAREPQARRVRQRRPCHYNIIRASVAPGNGLRASSWLSHHGKGGDAYEAENPGNDRTVISALWNGVALCQGLGRNRPRPAQAAPAALWCCREARTQPLLSGVSSKRSPAGREARSGRDFGLRSG